MLPSIAAANPSGASPTHSGSISAKSDTRHAAASVSSASSGTDSAPTEKRRFPHAPYSSDVQSRPPWDNTAIGARWQPRSDVQAEPRTSTVGVPQVRPSSSERPISTSPYSLETPSM